MTEKKKRGRPRKILVEPFNPGKLQEEFDKTYGETERMVTADKEITIKNPSYAPEKLIPPAGLSKTDVLKWYTEQNAKK